MLGFQTFSDGSKRNIRNKRVKIRGSGSVNSPEQIFSDTYMVLSNEFEHIQIKSDKHVVQKTDFSSDKGVVSLINRIELCCFVV